jgi:enoyl-CoA hydratase/carnithine racemase
MPVVPQYEFVLVEIDAAVAVVVLNRPDKLNAWHAPMRAELVDALHRLGDADDVAAIVLTGAGDRAFGAGQDLSEAESFDAERAEQWAEEWTALYGAIRRLDKPIIAALNGVAAGSAFQVALLCDLRIGHSGTLMGQPEINSGIPSVTGTWMLWDRLGVARTTDLILTGRLLDADESVRLGLLTRIVPEDQVRISAVQLAKELASKPPIAMRLNKQRLRELTEAGFQDAEEAGKRIQAQAFASGEPRAMMERFYQERAERAHA